MFQLDAACEAMMADPIQLLRLHAKTVDLLVARAKDGTRTMSPTFESVDRRYRRRGECVDASALMLLTRPIFPLHGLSDRELRVLLNMLPIVDAEESVEVTGAEPVRVLSALRRLLPTPAWQRWYTVCRARNALAGAERISGLELHLRDVMAGYPVEPVTVPEAVGFLVTSADLSASEADLLLEYCCGDPPAGSAVDAALLHSLLFAERMPGVVEYPILAARFAEATVEASARADSPTTGSLLLLTAFHAVLGLGPVRSPRSPEEVAEEPDLDFPRAVMEARLTGRQFYDVCRRIGTNFLQEQSDKLYDYLAPVPGALEGQLIVRVYRQYFPAVSNSHFHVVQSAVARLIARTGNQLAFYDLYARLAPWGAGPIPMDGYVAALRASGVPPTVVSDVALEWLRLKAGTRVDLALLLCMPVAPSREAVVRKLFERLDPTQRGYVVAADVLDQFLPERVEGGQVRQSAARWKAALGDYLREVEVDHLSYELFAFFWYLVAGAVEDDPTYTMVVWQGFSLAERRPVRR